MSIEHEMERIGKIIAADNGVEVVCRGVDAYCTEDRKVSIPSIETYAWLGRDAETMLHGLLDHETGHARDTDFLFVKKARDISPAFAALMNSLEDGYIEARQGARYRGCAQNFDRKNTWFWTRGASDKRTTQDSLRESVDVWSAFLLALTCVVRPYGGRTVAEIAKVRPDIARMLSSCEDDWRGIPALADKPRASGEVFKIAQRIYARFEDSVSSTKPSGRGPEGEGTSLGAPPPPSGESSEDEPSTPPPPRKTPDIALGRWTPPPKGTLALSPEEAIATRIHQVFDRNVSTQPYTNFDHSFDLERDFTTEDLRSCSTAFERLESRVRVTSDALVLAFEAALRARRTSRLVSGCDEGFVDSTMLPSFSVGSERADTIYQQPLADHDDRAVAVSILIDCSGSMRGQKAGLASEAALAMSRALAACNVAHEVTGFTTVDSTIGNHPWVETAKLRASTERNFRAMRAALIEAKKHGTDVSKFAREVYGATLTLSGDTLLVPIHTTFKSFASDDARALTRVEGIGENLDGEAVIWQARRLAARPEQRRVMFVLSDGFPAGSNDNAQGQRYLREVVERVVGAGIEIYGIGIMSTAVKHFYPTHWVISDLADLVEVAMESMTEVLTANRQERACVTL